MSKRCSFPVAALDFTRSKAGAAPSIAAPKKQRAQRRIGFTLMELMVVCTIAGVMIAIASKGISAAYAGNSRTSATRVVGTTLFQARATAIQRSRQSWLVRSGNTIKIIGDSLGTKVQVGTIVDLGQRYNVTLSSASTPTGRDTVSFDSRGLITGTTTAYKIIITKGTKADTVCVTGLGNTLARGC